MLLIQKIVHELFMSIVGNIALV